MSTGWMIGWFLLACWYAVIIPSVKHAQGEKLLFLLSQVVLLLQAEQERRQQESESFQAKLDR